MKLFYVFDNDTKQNAVIFFGMLNAKIWRNGIKPYTMRHYAINYLKSVMEEKVNLPEEPDEVIRKEPDESHKEFEKRVAGSYEHIGAFERIFPHNPKKTLDTPTTYYKSVKLVPPCEVWYRNEKKAVRDSDGINTVYIGPVEVYDSKEIRWIESTIESYRKKPDTAAISGLYILRDLSGYGSANPVCVTRKEALDLMRGWYAMDENAPDFDDVWRPANTDDLEKYWISED